MSKAPVIKQVANLIKEVEKENKNRQFNNLSAVVNDPRMSSSASSFGQHMRPSMNTKFDRVASSISSG